MVLIVSDILATSTSTVKISLSLDCSLMFGMMANTLIGMEREVTNLKCESRMTPWRRVQPLLMLVALELGAAV